MLGGIDHLMNGVVMRFGKHSTWILLFAVLAAPLPAVSQAQDAELTQKEAEEAARSVARFCKILVTRMEDLISDEWATQDLQDLSAVWDSLDCHQVFGIDERVRWLVR